MKNVNILMGPKLGDFIHSLTVPAYYHYLLDFKTNLYLNEKYDKFSTSLSRTYEELKPIMDSQPYINSFEIYDKKRHIYTHDLNSFRFNGLLYTRSFWAVFLHSVFPHCPVIPKNFVTLNIDKDETFKDYLLIHRKVGRFEWTYEIEKNYKNVLNQFDKKIFIDFDYKNYEAFKFKNQCDLLIVPDLLNFMKYINGCRVFLTNASGPLCMATAMNSPRIGELGHFTTNHYQDDHLFFDNCEFFDLNGILTPQTKYL